MDRRRKITVKSKAIHRIQIIQGHLQAVERMLQDNQYCVDIIHQSRAIQKALKQLDLLIMEDHLHHCVVHQIKNGQEIKTTSELLRLFEYK